MNEGQAEARPSRRDDSTTAGGAQELPAVLTEVVNFIRRFVILSDNQAVALALWVIHTHALGAFDTTPYIAITSAVKRCGKSILLEVLSVLVARPWLTGRATPAVLVRKIAKDQPTLLLDEVDSAFSGPQEYSEALRGTLNSGYRRGMSVSLCVRGKDWEPQEFEVFGAKAIAGIGHLPDTVADRSIRIVLRRRGRREAVERYRYRRVAEEASSIFEGIATWAAESTPDLQNVEPDVPTTLDDRAAEGWEPLLAIADLAEGDWPWLARRAALDLSSDESREDESLGPRLLSDIKTVFDSHPNDAMFSVELCRLLNDLEEAPWADIKGHSIDQRRLAFRLRDFDIKSEQMRIGSTSKKGYRRAMFEDAWSRYIPPASETSETDETPEPAGEANVSLVSDVSANRGMRPCLCGRAYAAFSPTMRPVCDQHIAPSKPCGDCGGAAFWAGRDSEWRCTGCNHPPHAQDVVEGYALPQGAN